MRSEPVVIMNLTGALLVCGAAFGLKLSGEQVTAVLGVVAAVATIVTRQMVTPNVKVK